MTSLKREHTSNIPSKVYVRSTRSGKVQKIVRELYLRQDIPCSSKLCSLCLAIVPTAANGAVLSSVLSDRPSRTKAFPDGHYVIPDTNALLNAMDLFEHQSVFYDVIILQTVLEELRNRSLPLYHRLIALTQGEKRFYVFFNEFRLETHVAREQGESVNDRNDRAIRRAAKWYGDHLKKATKAAGAVSSASGKGPRIVILTDDKENLAKARADRLHACTLNEYVGELENAGQLLDLISAQSMPVRGDGLIYPGYSSLSKMNTGIKAGTLHQGTFSVSPYNYLEGSVHVAAFDKPLLVLGRPNGNRSIHGDVVVVEVLPKDQWKAPLTKIIDEESATKNENADEEGEVVITDADRRALQEEVRRSHGTNDQASQPTARVIGIVKRNWRQYVGHVDQRSSSQGQKQTTVFLIPMDKRIPKIRIRTRQADELMGKRILVTIDTWERDSRYPMGHFVRSLGELESKGAETEALLLEYDVQYRPFPTAVLDCLPHEGHGWKVPEAEDPGWHGRKDLRDLLVCSIDPVGCQDIDDALHARPLANGNYEVGVHIADVSHFVTPNNAMDTEASVRGTTVYLVDKRIDMLPALLGTDLCSLKPYVERYAFSAVWEMSSDAQVISTTFTKSVIRSREAFSYEQAQLRIDDAAQQDALTVSMRTLLRLSQTLRHNRMAAGALNLASPEVRVQLESETSDPTDVTTKQPLATNSLVEEFMLLANTSVAKAIHEAHPNTALLRHHAAPPASNFAALAAQLTRKRDLALDVSSSLALATSLDAAVDPSAPFFNTLIRLLATRCMLPAAYFCAGSAGSDSSAFHHYGLAAPIYTHFTSPIRRYADLVVHRQLAAAIGYSTASDATLASPRRLEALCSLLNTRHRNAQLAGRASVDYYVGQALKGRVVEAEAWVMRVFSNGCVVFVPQFGIEGVLRVREMATPEPDAELDEEAYVLKVTGSREVTLELFAQVNVRVRDAVDESTGKRSLRMELI